jgi:hypothetical protein
MKTFSMRRWQLAILVALGAGLAAACNEIPQDQRKSFAGESEVKLERHGFQGDKAQFDAARAARASHSDDYAMVGGAKPQ